MILYCIGLLGSYAVQGQQDGSSSGVYERIMKAVRAYKPDTSAVPDNKTTRMVRKLREERGGFNINEAIAFKLGEEVKEGKISPAIADSIRQNFQHGLAGRWLENAMVRIYSESFSYRELKKLVKFYRTGAGRKLANDFPLILFKSMLAAELVSKTLQQK